MQQSLSSETLSSTRIATMQREDKAILDVHGIDLDHASRLEAGKMGRVQLCFRGLSYAVDDFVPHSLTASRSITPRVTAGEFVCRKMLRSFGYREDKWPELARKFLLKQPPVPGLSERFSNPTLQQPVLKES